MEVRVLGPLEVTDGVQVIRLSGRERQVLERLVAARRRAVPDSVMIDAIWGARPPSTARKTLQSHVHRLRGLTDDGVIVRTAVGYALGPNVEVDVEQVEADLAEARAAVTEHRMDDAAKLFSRAHARFRGRAMEDLADDPVAIAFSAEVEELELATREEAFANEIRRGRGDDAIGPLEGLVRRDPTRERTWCLLVEALARAGRQADALDAVSRAKRALARELGVEVGPHLRDLERAVLQQTLAPAEPVIGQPRRPATPATEHASTPFDASDRPPLVGRDTELGRIRRLLHDALESSGSALVLRGEPGIGKTSLMRWAGDAAHDFVVVAAAGVESEAELGFAALRDLLRPLTEHIDDVPATAARALEAALAIGPGVRTDPFSVSVGALELSRAAARHHPLAVLVDDFHWIDRASADVVRFVARRLQGERIALVVSVRADAHHEPLEGVDVVDVHRLDPTQSRELLRVESGLSEAVVTALAERCGGNPLALTEAVRGLAPAQRSGAAPLPDPLPLGERLTNAISQRIGRLPAPTQQALLIVASCLGQATDDLDGALGNVDLRRSDLEPAEVAGIVVYDRHVLRFAHPLLRSAVLHGASAPDRRAALRAVALSESNSERRAWGLALATEGRDEGVARLLEQVGDTAATRLALSAATAAFERAGRLGDRDAVPRRLVRAAETAAAAGLYEEARHFITDVLDGHADNRWHTYAELVLARVETAHGGPRRAASIIAAHAEQLASSAPADAAVMYANAAMVSFMPGLVAQAQTLAERACALATNADDERVRAIAATTFAASRALAGDRGPTLELPLATYLLANEPATSPSRAFLPPAQFLFWCGRYSDSRKVLDPDVARSQDAGAYDVLPYKLACRAELAYHEGLWASGRRDAEEAVSLAEATGQGNMLVFALVTLARFDAVQGRVSLAEQRAGDALRLNDSVGADSILAYAAAVLGLAALARDDVGAAIDHLVTARDRTESDGARNPIVVPYSPDLIEAYVRRGDLDAADACVRNVERSDGSSTDGWLAGVAARGRALLTSDPGDALSLMSRSVDCFEAHPLRFELARSLLWRGRLDRRGGAAHAARQSLDRAGAIFADLGARPWLDQVRDELATT